MAEVIGGLEVRQVTRKQRRELRDEHGVVITDLFLKLTKTAQKDNAEHEFDEKTIDAVLGVVYSDMEALLDRMKMTECIELYMQVLMSTFAREEALAKK